MVSILLIAGVLIYYTKMMKESVKVPMVGGPRRLEAAENLLDPSLKNYFDQAKEYNQLQYADDIEWVRPPIDVIPTLPPIYTENEEHILIHITSDKPVYKPQDVAFFKTYAVDALTKVPAFKNESEEVSYYH